MPGGFGTLDEFAEILTLVQTGKTRKIPIILVGTEFWSGLLDWFKKSLVNAGTISQDDLSLIQVIDDPLAIVDAIFNHYEYRCFDMSAEEHEIMLDL